MSPLVFDITRLIGRGRFVTPTGIDRFELHYAGWVRARRNMQDLFIETTREGPSIVRRDRAEDIIDAVRARWLERRISATQKVCLEAVLAAIEGERPMPPSRGARANALGPRAEALLSRAIGSLRAVTMLRSSVPTDTSLLHVSHARLDRPQAFGWLGDGARRGVFYVHDLIPVSHPEFVRANEPARHVTRMETVLRYAGLVICNTRTTAAAFCEFAQARRLPLPRVAVVAPGVDEAFLRPSAGIPAPGRPYFVCVSTIEPRKNHVMLLNVWRRLRERDGDAAPRLVIVGKRGWDNVDLFKRLDRTELPQGSVIEVGDLVDAALAPLVAGAAALLAPSFVEGYGMPVAEALALGTPVIASDIAAHREVAAGAATLIDPLDGPAWIAAIDAHSAHRRRVAPDRRVRGSWADHFRAVEALVSQDDGETWWTPVSAKVVPFLAAKRRARAAGTMVPDPHGLFGGRPGRFP